jgi:hypothetical protein
LEEFRQQGHPGAEHIRVLPQDGYEGANTGLVAVQLADGAVASYIQPDSGSLQWVVTMEPRDDAVTLDAESLMDVATELSVISALCSFLQDKSEAFVGEDAG